MQAKLGSINGAPEGIVKPIDDYVLELTCYISLISDRFPLCAAIVKKFEGEFKGVKAAVAEWLKTHEETQVWAEISQRPAAEAKAPVPAVDGPAVAPELAIGEEDTETGTSPTYVLPSAIHRCNTFNQDVPANQETVHSPTSPTIGFSDLDESENTHVLARCDEPSPKRPRMMRMRGKQKPVLG